MIEKMTPDQEEEMLKFRQEMFVDATGTTTNRPAAEKAALELVEGTMEQPNIHWTSSPYEAEKMLNDLGDSLRYSLWYSLRYCLRDRLWESLGDSLWDSLVDRLWDSLGDSLRDSIWDSLVDRLWDSLGDTGRIAFYSFCEKIGVKYSDDDSKMLACYRELNKHCFAAYVLTGHIILVDKPVKVKIEDGNLVDIQFRGES